MQWPQYTPSRHFLKLDYKKNDTDQKTYTPYVFHMPTEDVPGSFSRYKGNSSNSQYIWQKYKNHTNMSMFSIHYGNVFGEMEHSMYRDL